MVTPRELSPADCVSLIGPMGVGRLAVCTPTGPQIYPLNYVVDGEAIVFRTSPYGALGTLSRGLDVAFEVDHLDVVNREGWSVIVKGRADIIDEQAEIDRLRAHGLDPQPWASGMRPLYVRVPFKEITGRAVGEEWVRGVPVSALHPIEYWDAGGTD